MKLLLAIILMAVTEPPAPSTLSTLEVRASADSARVTWQGELADGVVGWAVEWSVAAPPTSREVVRRQLVKRGRCIIRGLEPGRMYFVRVYPYLEGEQGIQQALLANVLEPISVRVGKKSDTIAAPQGLTAVADGARVRLVWNPSRELGVVGYEILRRVDTEKDFQPVGKLRIDSRNPIVTPADSPATGWSSFIDTNVEQNKKYVYAVRSFSAGDKPQFSANSEPAPVTTEPYKLTGEGILLVINTQAPAARGIAQKYAKTRGIKSPLIVKVNVKPVSDISRKDFENEIFAPVKEQLAKHPAVTVIAIVRGVPWRILESGESVNPIRYAGWDRAAVDSELALARLDDFPRDGKIVNPLYGKAAKLSPVDSILGVCRLDAADDNTAADMVQRAVTAERAGVKGVALFDMQNAQSPTYKVGDEAIKRAADIMKKDGRLTVKTDEAPAVVDISTLPDKIAFYYGWYAASWKPKNKSFRFARGAVAAHLHSYAGNIIAADSNWVGEFLEHGATAAVGVAWEPLLDGFPQPDPLVDALLKGCNLAEASLSASRYLSWMTITCGDPLYRPFRERK